jgi:PAS domain S-box-containing protein
MKEQAKATEQLITELEKMRQRMAELEKAEIERERLKHKVLESENIYKEIVENSASPIYLFQDGELKFINDAFIRFSGYTKEELMEMDYLEIIHPDDREIMRQGTGQALTGDLSNLPLEPELKIICKNGEIKWVKLTPALAKYNGNYAIIGNVMDITSLKRTEQELKYRVEFDNLITTISTQFINLPIDEIDNGINHALQQIGEFAAVDRSYLFQIYDNGKKMDNTHEWCAEGIEPEIDNLKNLPTSDFSWSIEQLKESEYIYIPRVVDLPSEANAEKEALQMQDIQSLILVPMICSGNFTGFLGFDSVRREKVWKKEIIALLRIVGDIFANALERKRVEEMMRVSEAKYRAVVENAGEAIVVAQDGMLKFVNPKSTEITGYSKEELNSKPFVDFIHKDHRQMVHELHINRLRGEELPNIYPFKIIDNSGNIKWVEINTVLVTWEGRPATLNFLNDITERKRAEEMVEKRTTELKKNNEQLRLEIEERKRAEEKVRTYQEQLRALAAELSLAEERERRRIGMELHDDIGQNLAFANIKLGGLRELASDNDITEEIDQIREIIKQVIQHTRSLTFTLRPPLLYELGLLPALEWLVEQIQEQSGIHCDFFDDGQPKPMADDIRIILFKVVSELLINIVKHSQSRNATISLLRDGDNIQVSVEDDGVGFDTSKLDSNLGGVGGFGLFNIRERLDSIGGCLEIKSELDKGTRVTFWAPLK